ncbi:hypothetical protein OMP38_24490 [Cohnella ginsengisoli]|uniref:Uncharacterized protein n=1 Tax=Cohnella ginsengisoli TaxID=425004 RepID=A0A9X4KQ23_9BACL|nr:hypothetical protein [Cohnella ginsengisoli]MDG0793635.1 hypothetical protein [Cohnella ginsengisoli]
MVPISDFLQIKGLTGELKVSHKKGPFGLTLSTRELVVQKPHMNYYILFEHIVSVVPCESVRLERAARTASGEIAYGSIAAGSAYYAVYAKEVVVHHRGGIHRTGPMEFRLPIYKRLIEELARYGGLTVI